MAYTEIKHVSGLTINKANEMINELIAEGWQPAGRVTVSESMRFGVLMAKGVQSSITEIKIVNGLTITLLAEKVIAGMLEGYRIGDEIYGSTSQSFAVLYKGTRSTEGDGGVQGEDGPQGPAGEAGPAGPKGDKGDPGADGVNGATGPTGTAGPTGAAGDQGPIGPTGATGPKGDKGDAGAAGPQGPRGEQGEQGVPGEVGPVGLTFKGAYDAALAYAKDDTVVYNGSTWFAPDAVAVGLVPGVATEWVLLAAEGSRGEKGEQGEIGPQGIQGPAGADGVAGPTGATGPQGARGLQGVPGVAGPTGATGPAGEAGPQGIQGPAGPKGDNGDSGESPFTVYAPTITSAYTEMVMPLVDNTVFRARVVNKQIEYSLLSKGGVNRYLDWHRVVPTISGSTVTSGGGTTTITPTGHLVMGAAVGYNGLRGFTYTVKDWGSKTITDITVYHSGRSGDSTYPIVVRMISMKY